MEASLDSAYLLDCLVVVEGQRALTRWIESAAQPDTDTDTARLDSDCRDCSRRYSDRQGREGLHHPGNCRRQESQGQRHGRCTDLAVR